MYYIVHSLNKDNALYFKLIYDYNFYVHFYL